MQDDLQLSFQILECARKAYEEHLTPELHTPLAAVYMYQPSKEKPASPIVVL